jgi:NAD(P)-dependent dehydrogenase (short-subunit alcohol dehydrogenase family)
MLVTMRVMSPLADKVALVTGAGSGVGRAVALRFARAGAAVVGFDVNADSVKAVADQADGVVLPVPGDVRDAGALREAADRAADEFGGLDIVAPIAGITRTGVLLDMSDDDRDAVFGVNLIGVWNTIKAALPHLLRRGHGGRILACGSVESVLGGAGLAAYVATKHGLLGLIKSVALELATTGITANVISPAGVDTELLRAVVPPEAIEHIATSTPVGRLSTPDEVAAFFEFMAGPESGYMTGGNIVVDGGVALLNSHTYGQSWAEK